MTETALAILLSIADKPRHGYAILKEVQVISADRIRLSTGTLYGALKRFLERGWIVRVEERQQAAGPGPGRDRKAYALTRGGREVVAAEAARLRQLASAAEARVRRMHAAKATS